MRILLAARKDLTASGTAQTNRLLRALLVAGGTCAGAGSTARTRRRADHPAVVGWLVVEVEDPAHRRDEVRVGRGLPGGGGLQETPPARRSRRSVSHDSSATMPSV